MYPGVVLLNSTSAKYIILESIKSLIARNRLTLRLSFSQAVPLVDLLQPSTQAGCFLGRLL